MSLAKDMSTIPFFENRQIIDTSDESGIGIVGFKESEKDVYSSLIASPKSQSGIIPSTIMLSSRGCLLRMDAGEQTISISMCKEDDKEGFIEHFPLSVDNGEFFQSSLIHDFRHIDYDYIIAMRTVLGMIDDVCREDK